jgi:hypothetical protein
MLALMGVTVFNIVREGPGWEGLVAAAMVVGAFLVLANTIWRTRPVYAWPTHLEIGGRKHRRQVAFSELVSVERPWWAFNPVFAPQLITLRDGSRVLFFPAIGAEIFLRSRIPA